MLTTLTAPLVAKPHAGASDRIGDSSPAVSFEDDHHYHHRRLAADASVTLSSCDWLSKAAHKMNQRRIMLTCCPASYWQVLQQVPLDLFHFWAKTSHVEFPLIPRSAKFYVKSLCGLITYFRCVEIAEDKRTLLPSKAADSVWHAWLAFDKQSLDAFCLKNFSREIRHLPNTGKTKEAEIALVRTFTINSFLDGRDFALGIIPSLFSLDSLVGMPRGWKYARLQEGIYHCEMDDQAGWNDRTWFIHRNLSLKGFQALGLMKLQKDTKQDQLFLTRDRREQGGMYFGIAAYGNPFCFASSTSAKTINVGNDKTTTGDDGGGCGGGGGCGSACGAVDG